MKQEIHPNYNEINVTCACGHSFKTRSTMGEELHIEICSECAISRGFRSKRCNRFRPSTKRAANTFEPWSITMRRNSACKGRSAGQFNNRMWHRPSPPHLPRPTINKMKGWIKWGHSGLVPRRASTRLSPGQTVIEIVGFQKPQNELQKPTHMTDTA